MFNNSDHVSSNLNMLKYLGVITNVKTSVITAFIKLNKYNVLFLAWFYLIILPYGLDSTSLHESLVIIVSLIVFYTRGTIYGRVANVQVRGFSV